MIVSGLCWNDRERWKVGRGRVRGLMTLIEWRLSGNTNICQCGWGIGVFCKTSLVFWS